MKRGFFQPAVVSILLYGGSIWTLTNRLEKKPNGNYATMLRAILNKSWRQHQTKHQLYSHLPLITKTIQVRRTRHGGHFWRSRYELISDVLLLNPTYCRAKAGQPAQTYIQQLFEDTGCSPENLSEMWNDREKWRKRVRDTRAGSTALLLLLLLVFAGFFFTSALLDGLSLESDWHQITSGVLFSSQYSGWPSKSPGNRTRLLLESFSHQF